MKKFFSILILILINWAILIFSSEEISTYFVIISTIASIIFIYKFDYHKISILFLPFLLITTITSLFTIVSYITGKARLTGGYVELPQPLDFKYRVYHSSGSCTPQGIFDWFEDTNNLLLKGLINIFGYQKNSYNGYLPEREFIKNISTKDFVISDYTQQESFDANEELIKINKIEKRITLPKQLYDRCLQLNEDQKLRYKLFNDELLILNIKNDFEKNRECIILIDYKMERYIDYLYKSKKK
ncbi:MAG: hypothetical protein SFU98_01415 [Leptospiraceae bacterium]|nr:hypothetical protein [Leptospiraceae bacterium]